MALASAQKRMTLISRGPTLLTGVATMDGYVMRGLARW
jgi:hypothetical protein